MRIEDTILDLPESSRPRERLLQKGADKLTDAELIAILLGSGAEGKNALFLAGELLGRDSLAKLERRSPGWLMEIRGMGPAKVARLSAAFELTRRLTDSVIEEEQVSDKDKKKKKTDPNHYEPDTLARSLIRNYAHHEQEHLGALFLDPRNKILRRVEIFRGTISTVSASTREIVRTALQENAKGIVLFHNHPSGNPQPSLEDIHFTRKAKAAMELVDLSLIQHMIVGEHSYYSIVGRDVPH